MLAIWTSKENFITHKADSVDAFGGPRHRHKAPNRWPPRLKPTSCELHGQKQNVPVWATTDYTHPRVAHKSIGQDREVRTDRTPPTTLTSVEITRWGAQHLGTGIWGQPSVHSLTRTKARFTQAHTGQQCLWQGTGESDTWLLRDL